MYANLTLTAILVAALAGCGGGSDTGTDGAPAPDAAVDARPDAAPGAPLADRLRAIEGMREVEALATEEAGYQYFRLVFEQPADHRDSTGQKFGQVITLMHRDVAAPMILATTGYDNYILDRLTEPARIFSANQIVVEHRFFVDSRPDPADWGELRIAQAAADHHRIVEALRPIYGGPWISTGGSKGGMTSVYHRRFFPSDVDATIAYVAPQSFAQGDPRYQGFFDDVGTAACRQRLRDFQRMALERREELHPLALADALAIGGTFTFAGSIENAVEDDVSGLEWAFWQYLGEPWCDFIPTEGASIESIYEFIGYLGGIRGQTDESRRRFVPYTFQSIVELGYPAYTADYLADLQLYDGGPSPLSELPPGTDFTYDPAAMLDIQGWIDTAAEQVVFIYGEYDPWTAGAFDVSKSPDAHSFTAPSANHGAGIADLVEQDRQAVLSLLETWTGVTPVLPTGRSAPRSARELRPEPPVNLLRL